MVWNYKRLVTSIVAAAVILLVFFAGPALMRTFSKKSNYDRLFAEAQEAFRASDYLSGISALDKALEIEDRQDAYMLMADIYLAMDNLDKAIEVLYKGSYKLGSKGIASRLELLKARKNSIAAAAGIIEFDGQAVPLDETFLTITNRRLTDIAPLSMLTSLRGLILTDNLIYELGPLAGLNQLGYLHLGGNQIRDITALSGLSSLRTLNLDNNPIRDLSPLYALSGLETLSIRNVRLSDEQFEELTKALPACFIQYDGSGESGGEEPIIQITLGGVTFSSDVTELDLSGKNILDITSLSYCKNLGKLDLRDNYIADLSPLSELIQITWLNIRNNRVTDLAPLSRLYYLRYLDADNNGISGVAPISALSLEELRVSYNGGLDIAGMQNLVSLRRLGIKGVGLGPDDLGVFADFEYLEELELEDNEFTPESLERLKAVLPRCDITHSEVFFVFEAGGRKYYSDAEALDLSHSRISSLEGLEKFTRLQALDLKGNPLRNVDALSGLSELAFLSLDDTGISRRADLQVIAGLSGLRELRLEGNGLSDIEALTSLKKLEKLYIARNSLTAGQIAEFLLAMPDCTVYTDIDLSVYTPR